MRRLRKKPVCLELQKPVGWWASQNANDLEQLADTQLKNFQRRAFARPPGFVIAMRKPPNGELRTVPVA